MFKNCCGFKSEKNNKNESKETVDTSKEPDIKGNQDKEGSEKLTEMPNGLKIEYDVSGAVPVSEEEKPRVSKKSQKYPDALILRCITIEESNDSVAIEGVDGCAAKNTADGDVGERNKVTPTKPVANTHEFNSSETNRGAGDEVNLHKIEEEIAVRVVPRGILATPHPFKRGSMPALGTLPRWLSQEEDDLPGEGGVTTEPPATPVGRDELALRRHRFFSELLHVAQAGAEHRVHFDPLGPKVAAGADPEGEPRSPMLELNYLLARLEKVTTRLEQTVASQEGNKNTVGKSSLETIQDNNKVNAYRKIIQSSLATFLKYSKIIGGDAFLQAKYVHEAFMAQLQFLTSISQSGPMSPADMLSKLQPTSIQISAIQELRENKRQSDYFNHLSAISESIPALGWVTINQDPSHYVKEMNDAGQFYSNRVLKEWKEINKVHVDWVKAWVETLSDLQNYVQNYYSTGLVCYEIRCGTDDFPPSLIQINTPPTTSPSPLVSKTSSANLALPRPTLIADTNKRESLISKKETYHSPDDKIVNTFPSLEKSPKFSKDGKKWIVEYQTGVPDLMIDNVDMSDIVYMFKCQSTNLVIKGKLNSVILDSCCNSSIVFDSILTGIEFINCQSVHMQVLEKVHSILIDRTDGCQMYLSTLSLDVEILSSRSSELNVIVQKDDIHEEYPVPEQFKTTIGIMGLVTVALEHGH